MYNSLKILHTGTNISRTCLQSVVSNRCLANVVQNSAFKYAPMYKLLDSTVLINRPITPVTECVRRYAKGKDKKKDKGKAKVKVNETQLAEVVNIDSLKSHMQRSVEVLKDEFIKNLSLRSSAGSIESIVVEVDGEDHTLQELAQIVRKNPKMIVINMAVFPQAIPGALKAIQKSGMNLNPQQEGTTLYIPIPKVTKEHRENLAKNAKQLFIKCKDNIRDTQNKQTKSLKKKQNISEDLVHSVEQQIIAMADTYINEAQKILDNKQKELLSLD